MFLCLGNLLEFSNYQYSHKKYSVNPVSRDSSSLDRLDELDVSLRKEWQFDFEWVFAVASMGQGDLKFWYVNGLVVDEKHLHLEDLVQKYYQNSSQTL